MEHNYVFKDGETLEELIKNNTVDHMEGTLPESDKIPVISVPPPEGKIFFTDFPDIWHNKMTMNKFKIGDIFHRKHSRDVVSLRVVKIVHRNGLMEPEHVLKPIAYNIDDEIILGEEALEELYWLVKNIKDNNE